MHLLIDYGGTKFRYSFASNLHQSLQINTLFSKDVDFKQFLDEHLDDSISSLRISFAGQVSNGVILDSPNTNQKQFDIKKYLKERGLQTKLYLQNDLYCAALAVMHKQKLENFLLLFLGTGFGAAFVNNRKVLAGENNLGLEIGHIPFLKSSVVCGCGKDNCLELSVSGSAIKRWCNHFDIKLHYYGYDEIKSLQNGEAVAFVKNFESGLEHALHTSLTLFDPNCLVLGGGLFESSEALVQKAKEYAQSTPFAKLKNIKVIQTQIDESSLEGTRYL